MSVPSPDAILHLATLHLLSQAGFASTSQAASLSLTSVVAQFLKLITRSSIDRAILAGRSKPGALDVVESLSELGHGFGLEELYEYGLDHGADVFEGEGLDLLSDYLDDGRSLNEPLAELKLVTREEAETAADGEDIESTADSEAAFDAKDEPMEVDDVLDVKPEVKGLPPQRMRFRSPDYSWLPPRPDQLQTQERSLATSATTNRVTRVDNNDTSSGHATVPTSIADRYRTRIPFASSSLNTQAVYHTPPPPPATRSATTSTLPSTSPTSFPHLIKTYEETRNEMSVAIRPNGFRLQALDLLRRQIAAPDGYGPSDSLAAPDVVPGPKVSPIAVPAHPVAINPGQRGILSQLVHSIHSANLPPELRERLTSLRPPLAQKRDGQSLTYGPGIRGADQAALLKHQGKQAEEKDEIYAYATWDSGPRGQEKFSRGTLPKGKKVIKFVEGEEFPRQSEKRKSIDTGHNEAGPAPKTTLRLKLGESVSPAPPSNALETPTLATPPLATPGGTTIKLRIAGSQGPASASPARSPAQAPTADRAEEIQQPVPPSGVLPESSTATASASQQSANEQIGVQPESQTVTTAAPPTQPQFLSSSSLGGGDVDMVDRKPSPTSLEAASQAAVGETGAPISEALPSQ